MSETWDGRPENPERTGAHWIEDHALNHTACVVWCHVMEQWHDMAVTMQPGGAAKFWRYLGPCLTPAEVAAQVATSAALPGRWTVANHDIYAVLHRPDGTAAARFHVIRECEAVCHLVNSAAARGEEQP